MSDVTEQFLQLLGQALADGSFKRAVLAKPRRADDATRITVREVMVRGQVMLGVVSSFPTKDVTRNLPVPDGTALLRELIGESYQRAHLVGIRENIDLSISKKGAASMHRATAPSPAGDPLPTPADPAAHDRAKSRFVPQDRPYLRELGVTDAAGRVVPSMARKWKQINKFVEIVDTAVKESALSESDTVRVTDFGSGKGYLTFALHDHLQTTLNKKVVTRGVELRDDLVAACNLAAHHTHTEGLSFHCGDIATDAPTGESGEIDVMVALHACDTASDLAIARGIRSGAAIIVCSPCCHKELRPQIAARGPLTALLRHGVQLGLQAEMVTDTLRALVLETHGYEAKVFEFVGLEHSSKNKMILGVRLAHPSVERIARAGREIAELTEFFGITSQYLESDLRNWRP